MAATNRSTAFVSRAAGTAFGVITQIGFIATVPYLFLFLRDGSSNYAAHWISVDCALAAQFAALHSFLLLPSVRKAISGLLPAQLYGCLFAMSTCVTLWLTFAFWRASPLVVWDSAGWRRLLLQICFYLSWAGLFLSLRISGFGYQTGWTQWLYWLRHEPLPRRAFVERGAYRLMRHPAYLSFLGLIWFTPRMTADHAVLTAVWTIYVFVGSCLKDQRLLFYLGDTYREYARRVPGFPGMLVGPLAKWRAARMPPSAPEPALPNALNQAA